MLDVNFNGVAARRGSPGARRRPERTQAVEAAENGNGLNHKDQDDQNGHGQGEHGHGNHEHKPPVHPPHRVGPPRVYGSM